nr:hypothetical protein [Tanacetum cinerariifolium]
MKDLIKDSIYHKCGKIAHWKINCPQYLAELLKKKKNTASGAGGSGIFIIELNTILNRSWIYDTGCGTHIYNTTHGLRASKKLIPGALSLYVGNGQSEAVEAINAFYLCLPSGLEIVLNNCHYALSISRGFYISCKQQKSKLDLDSSLLWHYRLGHISKKRIKNLQHDGLLDSSGLRAFEECVSCMPGKMDHEIITPRTPPYTSQHNDVSERRNRTLLDMVKKTPYEVWHGKVPKLSNLKVWGCEKLVKRDTLTKPDKLEPRSIKCIFIGYPKETIGYSFYYPPENKALVARNVEFLENSLINQEISDRLEDPEIIQKEDTHPSIDTSLNHEEDDLEIDEHHSDIIPIFNETAKDLWDALERQMRSSEYGEQDRKAAILYEYETFKANKREQLLDTYLRYLQVINDLKKYGYKNDNYVNDALGYKKKAVVITSNPLALVDEKMNIIALLAKAFNRRKFYSKPTTNNLRTSSTSQSANKKQEFVKSSDKKEDKKADEKKRDMSKVKCYNCKKKGHFTKDCKKAKGQRLQLLQDKDVASQE